MNGETVAEILADIRQLVQSGFQWLSLIAAATGICLIVLVWYYLSRILKAVDAQARAAWLIAESPRPPDDEARRG